MSLRLILARHGDDIRRTRASFRLEDMRDGKREWHSSPIDEHEWYVLKFVVGKKSHTCASSTLEISMESEVSDCRLGHEMSTQLVVQTDKFFWRGNVTAPLLLQADVDLVKFRIDLNRDGDQCEDCDYLRLQVRLFPCDGTPPIVSSITLNVAPWHC
jgi:hypothetical protein